MFQRVISKLAIAALVFVSFNLDASAQCNNCASSDNCASAEPTCSTCQPVAQDCGGHTCGTQEGQCEVPSPHCYHSVTGGRGFLSALVDQDYTNNIGIYGGFQNINVNPADVFDGSIDLDGAGIFGFDVSRRHSGYLRSGFDFTYRGSDIVDDGVDPLLSTSNGDFDVYSLMKNFWFDFAKPCRRLNPYAGFGVGVAYLDLDNATYLGTPAEITGETELAYQVMAGLDYKFQPQASVFAEYRFFGTGEVPLESAGTELNRGTFSTHDLLFGFRFGY